MMKRDNRGSALLLSMIVVIMIAGIGGAFLVVATTQGKRQFEAIQEDEAHVVCESAIELTRRALLEYRNNDPFSDPNADQYAWNQVLAYCENISTDLDDLISEYETYRQSANYPGAGLVSTQTLQVTTTGQTSTQTDYTDIPTDFTQLFGTMRDYNGATYHVVIRNNNDIYGNGVDDDEDGDPWNADTTAERDAGLQSAIIDGDRRVFVIATAFLQDGTHRQVEALLEYPTRVYVPAAALLTDGTITMNGAFNILGSQGVVHANEDVLGSGGGQANVSVSVNASSDASTFRMANEPADGINSGVAEVTIPDVDPSFVLESDFQYSANVVVLSDTGITIGGGVTTSSGAQASESDIRAAFSENADGSWTINGGNAVPEAIYFIDGDFKMTGQGNTDPYYMTIAATGSVELGGNSKFYSFRDPSSGESTNTLVVAGQDVSLFGSGTQSGSTILDSDGNPIATRDLNGRRARETVIEEDSTSTNQEAKYDGLVLANEQVRIQGNYLMAGAVIAANKTDTPGSVVTTSSQVDPDATVGGTPTVVYNGFSTFLPPNADSVTIVAVRRLK